MGNNDRLDWEQVFEDQDHGLIPLISSAKSSDGLQEICNILVEFLYKRATDRALRDEFRFKIQTIFAMGMSRDDTIDDVVALLREIKDDRIERAGNARKEVPIAANPFEGSATDVFILMLSDELETRFSILQDGIEFSRVRPVPFILSSDFAAFFIGFVRRHVAPDVAGLNRGLITRADSMDSFERPAFFGEAFRDRKTRRQLTQDWNTTWARLTTQCDLPPKPETAEDDSLLSKLMLKGGGSSSNKTQKHEDWKREVRKIKADNDRARALCEELLQPSDQYAEPHEDHLSFLGALFGRSHELLQRQITAIVQLATQGGSIRAFEEYQKGKDIDLALLIASYRYPTVFLERRRFLYEVMRGYPDALRRSVFPLISEYLIDD